MHALTELPSEQSLATQELAEDIRWRHRSLLRELRIEVVEGGVILHGRAYSFYGKQIAQHEVLRRTGLVLLANRIAVAATWVDAGGGVRTRP